ncbi:hypothetical protein DPMN_136370 [Dreissena polymorpha]|uniref:Uncharacterized protein n=1 Tax=Dreissena polymorpha TaxID=45954 RepID=A0A9D4G5Q0_DREPO|nr:hypothetical protein DPMN_136370 [Dreissena polymorpha]
MVHGRNVQGSERPVQEQWPAVKHSCIHPQGREAEAVATCVRTDVAENGGRLCRCSARHP